MFVIIHFYGQNQTENLVNCPLKDYNFSYSSERKPESRKP